MMKMESFFSFGNVVCNFFLSHSVFLFNEEKFHSRVQMDKISLMKKKENFFCFSYLAVNFSLLFALTAISIEIYHEKRNLLILNIRISLQLCILD